jgi:hypothetical protein
VLSWALLACVIQGLLGCGDSNYKRENGQWFYDGVAVDSDIEPVNFVVIDNYFAKDASSGFYRGRRIYNGDIPSDAASFEVLNTWYAKDKLQVYHCDTERDSKEYWSIKRTIIKLVKAADPPSFRMMSDGYTPRDKSHVFSGVEVLPIRDVDSYELLDHGFSKDKLTAYYRSNPMPGTDAASFVALDANHARDKNKVYVVDGFYSGGTIKGVELVSFKTLGEGYAQDGKRAYYKGAVITRNDAGLLQVLGQTGYAKTPAQVFYQGQLLAGADAESFVLESSYKPDRDAHDRRGPFHLGARVTASP